MLLSLMLAAVEDLPMKSRFMTLESKSYMLLNPEFVAAGVKEYRWSPDGTQLVALAEDPRREPGQPRDLPRKVRFLFWSTASRREIGSFALPARTRVQEHWWEGRNGSIALALSGPNGNRVALLRVESNGSAKALEGASGDLGLAVSWNAKGIIALGADGWLLFYPYGQTTGTRIALPEGLRFENFYSGFDFAFSMRRRGAKDDEPPKTYGYDPATGQFRPIDTSKNPARELYATSGEALARTSVIKVPISMRSIWLVGDEGAKYRAALLSPNSGSGTLSLGTMNAGYIESGNLFVRRLQSMTIEQLEDQLECDEMQRLVSETKQVSTSIQIYLADNDDRFPPLDKFKESVMPFLRSEALFQGFIPTYKSGLRAEDVEDNAKEVVGYKDGDYGRAVTYADTHTVWESRRKRTNWGCEQ